MRRAMKRAMRRIPIVCVLTALGAIACASSAANAKPGPTAEITKPGYESTPAAWSIYLGPAGAMLESDYFNAPRSPFHAGRIVPCRLDRDDRGETLKLAYSCHGR